MLRFGIFFLLLASCRGNDQQDINNQVEDRIVGGNEAAIEKFPYMVTLQVWMQGVHQLHVCGGSIISNYWVLSATHCTQDYAATSLFIRAGSANEETGGSVHRGSQKVEHPHYAQSARYDNDISLIKVATPFVYSSKVGPVKLPAAGATVADGTVATVSGWGATRASGFSTVLLREVSVPVVSRAKCIQSYGADRITAGMMCAGYEQGGKDACQYDSGGPLVASGVQIGIVSWGQGCALANFPGVYAKVSYFREWIKENSGV